MAASPDRTARVLRGVAAGGAATIAAAVSHTLGGAAAPSVAALALALTSAVLIATVLAGRGWGFIRVTLAIVLGQAAYHGLFAALPSSPDASSSRWVHAASASPAAHASHAAPGELLHLAAAGPAASSVHGAVHGDLPMLGAHLLAAAVTVTLVLHGERALRSLVLALGLVLSRLVALPAPCRVSSVHRCTPASTVVTLRRRLLAHSLARRGPPPAVSFA